MFGKSFTRAHFGDPAVCGLCARLAARVALIVVAKTAVQRYLPAIACGQRSVSGLVVTALTA